MFELTICFKNGAEDKYFLNSDNIEPLDKMLVFNSINGKLAFNVSEIFSLEIVRIEFLRSPQLIKESKENPTKR